MYVKPTISVVELAVENNSCSCGTKTPTVLSKVNPANASCGPAFMTYSSMAAS